MKGEPGLTEWWASSPSDQSHESGWQRRQTDSRGRRGYAFSRTKWLPKQRRTSSKHVDIYRSRLCVPAQSKRMQAAASRGGQIRKGREIYWGRLAAFVSFALMRKTSLKNINRWAGLDGAKETTNERDKNTGGAACKGSGRLACTARREAVSGLSGELMCSDSNDGVIVGITLASPRTSDSCPINGPSQRPRPQSRSWTWILQRHDCCLKLSGHLDQSPSHLEEMKQNYNNNYNNHNNTREKKGDFKSFFNGKILW